ncbi:MULTISPECIES: TetR/AcrR family transcriptional regulator [Buttiauxella]|uniref:TetR/AcrR family transcriptional regulator n=1 Tax=Buttiauxella TaxID=82976 RepID=UPI0010650C52|nr:TetR/AcrR family transcriptional regulator [Buttiauxella sp. BIGb0552]MRT14386.1 TetR family transcriptional regulator [Enterobacteriaceae bacterium RIT711]TDX20226.1 TetR family transcriptional regulator [Buttiauxella sp. BIGb0552]
MKEKASVLKENILDAAIALFTEKGVEKVTTRELTEQVGIARSHIYHYFPDWQTLCIEAFSRFMYAELAAFSQKTRALPPEQGLNIFVEDYLPDRADAVWELYGSLWRLAVHNKVYAELALTLTEKWDALLASIIESGIESGVFRQTDVLRVTRQLGALLNGYSDQLIIDSAPLARDQALEDIQAFISQILITGK